MCRIFKMQGEKGFTLIELLVIIAILGVLGAAVIPNVASFITTGHVGAANGEVAVVHTALNGYLADHDGATGAIPQRDILPYTKGVDLRGEYTLNADGTVTPTYSGYDDLDISHWTGDKWVK